MGDAKVVVWLLCLHRTSASTERNWALWAGTAVESRNAPGLTRAIKLIMFCFNSRAQHVSIDDLALCLDVVETQVASVEQVNL